MTIVSTREFRANQTKYLCMADLGEHVILRSRQGKYRLTPIQKKEPKRDLTTRVCQALKDWKDYLDGDTSKMLTWEELQHELQD